MSIHSLYSGVFGVNENFLILYGITFNNTIVESIPEPDPRKAWSKEINLSAMERIFSRRM